MMSGSSRDRMHNRKFESKLMKVPRTQAQNSNRFISLLGLVVKMACLVLHACATISRASAVDTLESSPPTSAISSHYFDSFINPPAHSPASLENTKRRLSEMSAFERDALSKATSERMLMNGGRGSSFNSANGSLSGDSIQTTSVGENFYELGRVSLKKNNSQDIRSNSDPKEGRPKDGEDGHLGRRSFTNVELGSALGVDLERIPPAQALTAIVRANANVVALELAPSTVSNSTSATGLRGNKSSRSIAEKVVSAQRRHDKLSWLTSSNRAVSLPLLDSNQAVDVAESRTNLEQNPDCALVLKRTYILKPSASSNSDEWGEKFVFNDVDPDEAASEKRVHKRDLCIKYTDVDRSLEEAKHRIKFSKPDDLESPEVSERSLASIGELNLAAGLLLTKRFDLSHDEIMNALPMIDMSTSNQYWKDLCPKHVRPMMCSRSRYRTLTAHCNNLKHPSWGASKTPYSRYLPPDYADGLSAPRAARNGEPLPSARLITSIVHQDADEPSHDYSILFADWGQLLNHDVTRIAVGEAPDCCPQLLKGLCMPIPVPPGDPLYSKFDVKCLKFERALAAIRPKCLLGPRAQINLITSPVDASFVYGSTEQQARRLRAHNEGRMKVLNYFEKHKLKPLLPPKLEEPDKDCFARPKHLFCFEAGDVRVNEQTHLTVLHTIYVREHNRIAKQLAKINMEWDDDKLYQETRHIVIACVQHVMVNEFLPLLLGKRHMDEYKLMPTSEKEGGFWKGYDPSVTISTGTAFAAAAYRYGHSMVEGVIRRLEPDTGAHIKSELLRFLFKRPFWLYEPGAVDQLLAGMLLTPAEQTDPHVSEELSGHLFQPPKAKFGHDLAAINIQRGRDTGVPGYNDWREWCGLPRAKSFSDLEPLLMNRTAWQYSKIHKHVDDIDLWSAGISERKLPGSAVGPTMACIIARQFLNFKRGDRFWYENPGLSSSFTANQLREIKKISLAKILCTNSDELKRIQPWAMRLPHPIYNAKVPCESLPTVNLKYWDSSLMDSFD